MKTKKPMTGRRWLDRLCGLDPDDLPDSDCDWDSSEPGDLEECKAFVREECGDLSEMEG